MLCALVSRPSDSRCLAPHDAEKSIWELGESPSGTPYEQIPHNMDAVETTLYFAKFLNTEARQSTHKFDDPAEEEASLIWQYPVFYTAPEFVQSYVYEF